MRLHIEDLSYLNSSIPALSLSYYKQYYVVILRDDFYILQTTAGPCCYQRFPVHHPTSQIHTSLQAMIEYLPTCLPSRLVKRGSKPTAANKCLSLQSWCSNWQVGFPYLYPAIRFVKNQTAVSTATQGVSIHHKLQEGMGSSPTKLNCSHPLLPTLLHTLCSLTPHPRPHLFLIQIHL